MVLSGPWDNHPSIVDGQLAVALHLFPHEAQCGVLTVEAWQQFGFNSVCGSIGTSFDCFVKAVLQSGGQFLDWWLSQRIRQTFDGASR